MKVKLKVLKGSSAGKEIRIPTPKCIVGRGDDCHLRPKSDAISRRHCEITVQEGRVIIQDLGSKNGTLVNGERIDDARVLQSGDSVQFGPLSFEILIDHTLGGEKKPKVSSIKEAAVRTTAASKETAMLGDGDISDWLEEADEVDRERRLTDPETRQLRMDETDQVTLQKVLEQRARERKKVEDAQPDEDSGAENAAAQGEAEKSKKKRKTFGKLPERPSSAPDTSRDAAADMLRKFFNKR
jgi:pSer/pThr/pTyr-binding forkhead associated (FHA) protein